MHPFTPAATTPATDPHPGLSVPVNRPLLALLEWSTDPYDCEACAWTCEPVNRAVLGNRWGGSCAFHHGTHLGAQHATDWTYEDYPGRLGWRRAARALARLLLNASFGDYTRAARRAARDAARDAVWGRQ